MSKRPASRSSSPTPSERERADAELRVKEAAEQATLPYKWTQTIKDVDITVPVPGNIKGKDLDVVIKKQRLKVGLRGQEPIMEVGILRRMPKYPRYQLRTNPTPRAISRNQSTSTSPRGPSKPPL